MKIYIPSMGRGDERIWWSPAAQMPHGVDVTYVVPPSELGKYAVALLQHRVTAKVIACPEKGIAATRYWIGQHAFSEGATKFCMMDDDIGFQVRKAPDTWQLRGTTPEEVGEMISWIERSLDQHEHVGISTREGNNRGGTGDVEKLTMDNTRTLRVLAYQTAAFLSVEHCRVDVMEDFDVNLQLLENGGSNVVSYWWAQGQRMTNEEGGCSTYRSHEVHEASARKLRDLHPNFVQLRQKQNKTGGEFGTRVEVTIQWKSAWLKGQKAREQSGA